MNNIQVLFNLSRRLVLLTGGAGLLGQCYVNALLKANAIVIVADINEKDAKRVAFEAVKESGGEAYGYHLDVSDKKSVQVLSDAVFLKWGRVDILVNNAAIDPKFDQSDLNDRGYKLEEYPSELWQKSIETNLTGVFNCCQVIGKAMVEQGYGVIVNISSTYGMVAPNQSIYRKPDEVEQSNFKPPDYPVTKAGVAQLTRYLAAYWKGKNIRVNTLTPGGVYNDQDPEFIRRYSDLTMLGRLADKSEMCGPLLLLVSDASSYMTGANLVVDGGWTAW